APKGHKYQVPKVDLTSPEGVREALASPALSVRYMAQEALRKMPVENALACLKPALDQAQSPTLRARALWMVSRLIPPNLRTGTPLLPGFEAAGAGETPFKLLHIRAVHDLLADHEGEFGERSRYWLNNVDAGVRRELLLALRDTQPAVAKPL